MKKFCLQFKIQTNAKKNCIDGLWQDNIYKLKINAPPIENKANKKIIDFLSKLCKIKKYNIRIKAGEKSKMKVIEFSDVEKDYILSMIESRSC